MSLMNLMHLTYFQFPPLQSLKAEYLMVILLGSFVYWRLSPAIAWILIQGGPKQLKSPKRAKQKIQIGQIRVCQFRFWTCTMPNRKDDGSLAIIKALTHRNNFFLGPGVMEVSTEIDSFNSRPWKDRFAALASLLHVVVKKELHDVLLIFLKYSAKPQLVAMMISCLVTMLCRH